MMPVHSEDPFLFPLARFRALSDEEKAELVRRADVIARDRVDRELEARHASWLVLVGDQVVRASADPQAIPSADEVLRLGEPQGLVAYLFEAPLIEEVPGPTAAWTPLEGSDRYPTIALSVGAASEAMVSIVADLDTGSHGTLIDADLVRINPKRTALVGRDFLRAFSLSVVLEAREAETEIVAGE